VYYGGECRKGCLVQAAYYDAVVQSDPDINSCNCSATAGQVSLHNFLSSVVREMISRSEKFGDATRKFLVMTSGARCVGPRVSY
jgi:hypothetical protein